MDIIKNFDLFKEKCSTYPKSALRALLWNWAFQRILAELTLADIINSCDKDGKVTSKSEMEETLQNTIEGERILIGLLGRDEAAKVYGRMEGITSDMKTVDYVLSINGK